MKSPVHRFFQILLEALALTEGTAVHGSQPADSLHYCLVRDPELEQPRSLAAGKRLEDLNTGEPRTVRLFYFLPNNHPFRPDVVQRTKDEILNIQTSFGDPS